MIAITDTGPVRVESSSENIGLPRRSLDLNNIANAKLQLLRPLSNEIPSGNGDRQDALTAYSDRLRESYKQNDSGLRDGLKLLSETLDGGQSINISCACRSGEMCHADVVKMAIEKVSSYLRQQTQHELRQENSVNAQASPNPRTMRAVAEILAVTKNDLLLESIGRTDGRNRSEHASYLGKSSQFVRDLYERGATIVDGQLIVPSERLADSTPLAISTQEYAVKRIERIVGNESKSKEIAPLVVEYGSKIAGQTADGETKIKVFTWIYEALEGKNTFLPNETPDRQPETSDERFTRNLNEIRVLAEQMHQLEPTDKLELQPLRGEDSYGTRELISSDEFGIEEIYEEALSRVEDRSERSADNIRENQETYPDHTQEVGVATSGFERIELDTRTVPQLPANLSEYELEKLFEQTLPLLDRQLESGRQVKEILEPFREIVYQTAKHDPLNKAEAIKDLRFAASYINYQLKQPESRLRHENERYRNYAARLEQANTRTELIDQASAIRTENAAIGLKWENIAVSGERRQARPLTLKEMQFLFTEGSPAHYTAEMTVARLAYSHSGASRRLMADALVKGDIKPSTEAKILIDSLESRLQRRTVQDSISATKHFFQSIKTPNEGLRYKNAIDHKEIYGKLPPPEKDFVYQRAVLQKEGLEYRLLSQQQEHREAGSTRQESRENRNDEKLALLREGVKSDLVELLQKSPDTNGSAFIDQTNQILARNLVKADLVLSTESEDRTVDLSRQVGEKIENRQQLLVHHDESTATNQRPIKGRHSDPDRPNDRNTLETQNGKDRRIENPTPTR